MAIDLSVQSIFELSHEPPSKNQTITQYSLSKDQFETPPPPSRRSKKTPPSPEIPYLIIGFDTEFQTPDRNFTNEEIRNKEGKYEVLSYQFHAIYFDGSPNSQSWQGITCPASDDRMPLGTFISFAIGEGIQRGFMTKCPLRIYLVGHFTRADIPAFSDFKDLIDLMSNVRNTFISTDSSIPLKINFPDGEVVNLSIILRDTMLLTPASSKSLSELGRLLEVEKISLDSNGKSDQYYKENMTQLRKDNWELFKAYALTDARICAEYAQTIIMEYRNLLTKVKLPATLTSIGVNLLLDNWQNDSSINFPMVLGKETIPDRVFNKKHGYFKKVKKDVYLAQVDIYQTFATESYHGGRNEQFWFGPGYEANWTDYDLASAYPTSMSLIGMPDWVNPKFTKNVNDFGDNTFGFAYASFKFPDHIRYPCIPVRTDNGLIFPLSGKSFFCAPELSLAIRLGAEITIDQGIVFPTNEAIQPFGDFVADCIKKRKEAGDNKLQSLFWKEITNSTYGKTAQGLREKRVFDMRDRGTRLLPESLITNPFYAAMITSSVRAVLAEIMNSIPGNKMVFSCTTDGFLTDATEAEIQKAQSGDLCKLFSKTRRKIAGTSQILDVKHRVSQPLGWRTRGQATLKPHDGKDGNQSEILLAKGGIRAPKHKDTTESQNAYILETFFGRTPTTPITVDYLTSVRDMVFYDADLVGKSLEKTLNMEFDWKRCPAAIGFSEDHKHIAFSTRPWSSADQFFKLREHIDEYKFDDFVVNIKGEIIEDSKGEPKKKLFRQCLKTVEDYQELARYIEGIGALNKEGKRYLHKKDGPIKRLRQCLAIARRLSVEGLTPYQTDKVFAEILVSCGIPCSVRDIENAKKSRSPVIKRVPRTSEVLIAMDELLKHFPRLNADDFLVSAAGDTLMPRYEDISGSNADDFVRRLR